MKEPGGIARAATALSRFNYDEAAVAYQTSLFAIRIAAPKLRPFILGSASPGKREISDVDEISRRDRTRIHIL